MIKHISHNKMGKSERGWLHSTFHFSFAEYRNPDNIQFGALRVVNDDQFDPHSGFDTHPHSDMEIISYVVGGELTHKDSMGNSHVLMRGQVQYMSAGTGVTHSEHNMSEGALRFLQIWILPDKGGYAPRYGDYRFAWKDRENKWLKIVSKNEANAPVSIHQDVEISVISMDEGSEQTYNLEQGRMAYLIQIEGEGSINAIELEEKDAAEITSESKIALKAKSQSHYILFDLANAEGSGK